WPAIIALLAAGLVVICRLLTRPTPTAARCLMSARSADSYATAPCGAITRTVIRSAPRPKPARAAGAQLSARLVPNWRRKVGVTTTTVDFSGYGACGPSRCSCRGGNPSRPSAWHIAGSQDTTSARLTCAATHVATLAMSLARRTPPGFVAALPSLARTTPLRDVSTTATTPPATSTAASATTPAIAGRGNRPTQVVRCLPGAT